VVHVGVTLSIWSDALNTCKSYVVFSDVHVRYMLSPVRLSSLSLSSVTLVRPTQGLKFPQYFYGIWYLGHPLTSTENFTEIGPGERLRRRGVKHKWGSQTYRFWTYRRLYLGNGAVKVHSPKPLLVVAVRDVSLSQLAPRIHQFANCRRARPAAAVRCTSRVDYLTA